MTLWECNSCKATVEQNDYSPSPKTGPKNAGWIYFTQSFMNGKTMQYREVHLCPTCLKKVMQFLGAEW